MESSVPRRILVGWDNDAEIELISMYLEAGANVVQVVSDPDRLLNQFSQEQFDVVVFPATFPTSDKSLAIYENLREIDGQAAIIAAARPGEIYPLSRLIRRGLTTHIYRDPAGEYLFLLQTMIDSAVEGKLAEEQQQLVRRLQEEVESVRKLQETIIPKNIKPLANYKVSARYEPSQIKGIHGNPIVLAGGDYYDAFRINEKRMLLLVGDASGHGMKACMSIMSLHTLVNQIHNNLNRPPHEFVDEINRHLCSTDLIQSEGGFITLLLAVLDHDRLHWTSAGHCMPLLQNLETNEFVAVGDPRENAGSPLGVFEDSVYSTVISDFPPGHRLLIYTDGLPEAFPANESHAFYGLDGIKSSLSAKVTAPLGEALDALFDDSNAFTRGSGRHDDTSALLLEHCK